MTRITAASLAVVLAGTLMVVKPTKANDVDRSTYRSDTGITTPIVANRGASREVWEYKVEEFPLAKDKHFEVWLNERGKQGWEVCGGSPFLNRFMFKRRTYRF
jgi:hypothetical protein